MLTDEQREALEWCIGALEDPESKTTQAILDTVRGLLSSAAPAEGREAGAPGKPLNPFTGESHANP